MILVGSCSGLVARDFFVNKINRDAETSWRNKIWWPTARGATPYLEPGQVLQHRQVPDVSIYGDEFDLIKLCDNNAIIDCVKDSMVSQHGSPPRDIN